MDYPKVAQKPVEERTPFPASGNSDRFQFTFHAATAVLEEVQQLHSRLEAVVARMDRYGVAELPEMTRWAKRIKGSDDLKAFVDVLEDTLNWEIRVNVDVAPGSRINGVSDVSE